MRSEEGKMLMAYWDRFYRYISDYPELICNITPLRYATVIMVIGYIGIFIINYKKESSQNYILNNYYYHPAWIFYAAYGLIFSFHVLLIADGLGLVPEEGYGQIFGPIFMFLSLPVIFLLERLGHNLICWYLGTPLWPWNPFAAKPGFEKIVAKNRRDNKKRWLAEQRRKRLEGKRYSD
jgi:hypothetical protein